MSFSQDIQYLFEGSFFITLKEKTFIERKLRCFAVSRFLTLSAKFFVHKIVQNLSFAKVYAREIFQNYSYAKINVKKIEKLAIPKSLCP